MNIIITISDGFHLRYLVDTNLVFKLIKKNHCITLVMPTNLEIGSRKNILNAQGIGIERVPNIKNDFIKRIILKLRLIQSNSFSDINSIKIEQLKKNKLFVLLNLVLKPFSYNFTQSIINFLILIGPSSKLWKNIFLKYNPDLLFLSTPGQKTFDLEPLHLSFKKNIPSYSSIYSLDNLTAKGKFFMNTNYLSVWSQQMKEDAVNLHGYSEKNVYVDGATITDSFFYFKSKVNNESRNIFLQSLGFKSNDRLITIATIPQYYWGNNHINLAKDILSIDKSIKILIKPHPLDLTDYSELISARVAMDPFHGGFLNNADQHNPLSWKAPENHIENLSNIMMFSDMVVNIASSIAIDASIFETPGINIAFDYDDTNQILPAKKLYDYTHYKRIISTNGTYFVYDKAMLAKVIKSLLSGYDPALQDRKNMAKNIYGQFDGMSINRIISHIKKDEH